MTAIVAIKDVNKVYMGCDSIFIVPSTFSVSRRSQSKIIILDEMIIGMTALNGCRVFQTIQHKFKPPSTRNIKSDNLIKYFCTSFHSSLYKLLQKENLLTQDVEADGTEKKSTDLVAPFNMLIGIRDRLFEVGEDFDITEIPNNFAAVGSVSDLCLGSLQASTTLMGDELSPQQHILLAMSVAEKFSAGIRAPYQLTNTETLCLETH